MFTSLLFELWMVEPVLIGTAGLILQVPNSWWSGWWSGW